VIRFLGPVGILLFVVGVMEDDLVPLLREAYRPLRHAIPYQRRLKQAGIPESAYEWVERSQPDSHWPKVAVLARPSLEGRGSSFPGLAHYCKRVCGKAERFIQVRGV
jgi:hypothetical protein